MRLRSPRVEAAEVREVHVVFSNHQIDLNGNVAIAMGTYDFTDATDGSKTTVEIGRAHV